MELGRAATEIEELELRAERSRDLERGVGGEPTQPSSRSAGQWSAAIARLALIIELDGAQARSSASAGSSLSRRVCVSASRSSVAAQVARAATPASANCSIRSSVSFAGSASSEPRV